MKILKLVFPIIMLLLALHTCVGCTKTNTELQGKWISESGDIVFEKDGTFHSDLKNGTYFTKFGRTVMTCDDGSIYEVNLYSDNNLIAVDRLDNFLQLKRE